MAFSVHQRSNTTVNEQQYLDGLTRMHYGRAAGGRAQWLQRMQLRLRN
jgi:hypothetical protein